MSTPEPATPRAGSATLRGELLTNNRKRDRMTRNEVEEERRLAGIAHRADVAWAILETNGRISFIERGESSSSRQQDEPAVS